MQPCTHTHNYTLISSHVDHHRTFDESRQVLEIADSHKEKEEEAVGPRGDGLEPTRLIIQAAGVRAPCWRGGWGLGVVVAWTGRGQALDSALGGEQMGALLGTSDTRSAVMWLLVQGGAH